MRAFSFMVFIISLIASLYLFATAIEAFGQQEESFREITLDAGSIERGRRIFMERCNSCHGLKYLREGASSGLAPLIEVNASKESFGIAPPDLSLMASARGKGKSGARYIERLLTSYYTDTDGGLRNRAFAEETEGDGTIAMPMPFDPTDPELSDKAHDVASFLLYVSAPEAKEREKTGWYVLIYMTVLTGVLYALNRATWKGVKKG